MSRALLSALGGAAGFALCLCQPVLSGPQDQGFTSARERLVRRLRHRGIRNRQVLDSISRVPRHAFVPPAMISRAYRDQALPIASGQTISQPYVVALMTELLRIKPGAKVLEIGTGSGYQAAVLAEMGAKVYSIELLPELAKTARLRLAKLGYQGIHLKVGDGFHGWARYAPFDAVVVTAAAPRIPPPLVRQLVEGGIIVIPLNTDGGGQILQQGIKRQGNLRTRQITGVRFVPMRGLVEKEEAVSEKAGSSPAVAGRTDTLGPLPLSSQAPLEQVAPRADGHGEAGQPAGPDAESPGEGAPLAR